MDKLRALELAIKASDKNSFAEAAICLGQSPSSVSKSITRLEKNIGFKIFNRTTRILNTTEQGRAYIVSARALLEDFTRVEQQIRGANDKASGTVRLNVPFDYGLYYIQPFVSGFRKLYPEIKVELFFNDSYVSSVEREVDFLIRTGSLNGNNLVAQKLSPMDFLICASPGYIKNNGVPKSGNEFDKHNWLRFHLKSSGKLVPIMYVNSNDYEYYEPEAMIVSDCGTAIAEMCASGLGLAQLPHFLARKWLLSGELVSIFPAHCPPDYGVFVLYNGQRQMPLRCRLVLSALQKFVEARKEFSNSTWASELV